MRSDEIALELERAKRTIAELQENLRKNPNDPASVYSPLDIDDPEVTRTFGDDFLFKNMVTNNCSFSAKIHEELDVLLDALLGNQTSTTKNGLYQEIISESNDNDAVVTYWGFMLDQLTACGMILRLEKQNGCNNNNNNNKNNEVWIEVSSVDDSELEKTTLPSPYPAATKSFQLLLKNGMIILQPLPLGQTSLTFTAQASLGKIDEKVVPQMSRSATFSSVRKSRRSNDSFSIGRKSSRGAKSFIFSATGLGFSSGPNLAEIGYGVIKAEEIFSKLAGFFFDRFKKEAVIDARMKEDFMSSILKAPPTTPAEQVLIKTSMDLVDDLKKNTKRFFYNSGEGAGWTTSFTRIDMNAQAFFTELWLLDTYEKKARLKDVSIFDVRKNIDGTRAMQYSRSINLPGGFQDRFFQAWITWDIISDGSGRRTFVIAFAPLKEYEGTQYDVPGAENMMQATSRGVYVVRELTENTCEWTRAQQVDLNIVALPAYMLDFLAKQQLAPGNEIQQKFRRNGREVDRETRDALAAVMREQRGRPLMDDQVPAFERCMSLQDGGGEGWKVLKPPPHCTDTKMWLKYIPPQKGERSIGTGRAVGVVDSSAEDVGAWVMDYCSNDRMRISIEEGNPARLELRNKARINENSVASLKAMPFFLDKREAIVRQVWKSEKGKIFIAIESVDGDVDYGVSFRKTRLSIKGLWVVENLDDLNGVSQCRATLMLYIDAGGNVPTWVANKMISTILDAVQEAINEFRQDETIDAAETREFHTKLMAWKDERFSAEEDAFLQRLSQKFEESLKEGAQQDHRRSSFLRNLLQPLGPKRKHLGWKQLRSLDVFVKMEIIYEENSTAGIGRGTTIVDAPILDCAAWEFCRMTRERLKADRKGGGLEREVVKLNDHSHIYYFSRDFGVLGFAPREWLTKCVWKMLDENTMIVGFEDIEDDNFPIGAGKNYVRGSSAAFWKYERLPEIEGIPQTSIMYCAQVDLKGLIPKAVADARASKFLQAVSRMRKKFDRSLGIDAGRRAALVQIISRENFLNEDLGESAQEQFEKLFEERKGCERPSWRFGMADSLVFAERFGGHAWGRTFITIRAGVEEVAAFIWDYGSRTNMEISKDIERTFEEGEDSGFMKSVTRRHELSSKHGVHHRDRTFASDMTLKRVDCRTIFVHFSPMMGDRNVRRSAVKARGSMAKRNTGSVGGRENVTIRLRKMDEGRTIVEYACTLDVGSHVSRRASKAFVEQRLLEIVDMSIYFQRLVPLKDYRKDDGQALGHDLLWNTESSGERVERLMEVLERSTAMRELLVDHPFLKAMMIPAVRGYLNLSRSVATKLICISEAEATQIGKNLTPALKSKKVIRAGVDQWRIQNRAVKELMAKYAWFEPMISVLGTGIVKAAAWGLMWRVCVGAVLSLSDLISDILILKEYWEGGDETLVFRNLTLASLATSMVLQLLIVFVQNRKMRVSILLKETAIVLIGMKSPWDAYRVASGAEKDRHAEVNPMMEMTMSKCIELFAESLPGIMVQLSSILQFLSTGKHVSYVAVTSLALSTFTTGFVSATISYDMDTDPISRLSAPKFYGYVPDSKRKRATLFFTMMNLAGIQALFKSLLLISLGSINLSYAWAYLLADIALVLVIKLLRGDIIYWIPIYGTFGVIISFLIRIIAKVISDFTATIQLRHPYEMGGFYFTMNLFIPLLGMIALISSVEEGTYNEETEKILRFATLTLGISLVLLLSLFFLLINKEYMFTFFTTMTAKQYLMDNFINGPDEVKAVGFYTHKSYMKPYIDQAEKWIQLGWHSWEKEEPEWFTEEWKDNVPASMKPKRRKRRDDVKTAPKTPETPGAGEGGGRKKSLLKRALAGNTNKVTPAGNGGGERWIDVEEFKRELVSRGSVF
ncbi:hypothetical protein TL16_g03202 [Triparma laevis f. inornata]|uniref:Uncharacterized protein n=1 Tax=Triparma laevis f. inornata TaxID=1714386 RepID=A0A9W7A1F0_9STRA|nr:hypothetical protein TL16_g03202 [Triparma laevis f. inornata]